ncbi:collectin-10 isoform X4 [Electrophorus electricus]|uniref:collectin-10 isoform X4 n=1 Tax=Electrophorus electricus TaxID=8005 RepID=UPI000F09BF51|nr:collectin-10 isoform X4 [Electrophorus electricus]
MAGQSFVRKSLLVLLVLHNVSSDFATEMCSNTILPGSKGDPGDVGDRGDEGRQGKTGPSGHRGLPGDTGEKGAAGRVGKLGLAGERGTTCDCGRYRKVVGQMDVNIGKLKSAVAFVKHVVLGIKETEEKSYLLPREALRYRDAVANCRLRGGVLAVAENTNATALLAGYVAEAGLTHALVNMLPLEAGGDPTAGVSHGNATGDGPQGAISSGCLQMGSDGTLSWTECDAIKYFICEFPKK